MKTKTQEAQHPWSVPIVVAEIPEGGRQVLLVADEHTRDSVARLAGLRSLPRLEASFELTPYGRDGLHVVGQVSGTVGQTCVITLDPIEGEVHENIDLVFARQAPVLLEEHGETVELVSESSAEPVAAGIVDLGIIATEFLILGIDPYPRKPGAVFDSPSVEDDSVHPFSALAALKTGKS
jgi:hypothetical protein